MRSAIVLKYCFLIFTFLWLAISGSGLHAQQRSAAAELRSGRIITATDSSALAFVQVYNRSSGKGTTSNPDGQFRLMARMSDSIEFRMIGYVDTVLNVYQLADLNYQVPMRERVYQLRQFNLRGNRQTQAFAPAAPSKDPYVGYRSVKPSGRSRQEDKIGLGYGETGAAVTGAVTAFANLFNSKHKQREKIRALQEKQNEEKYYQALFDYWFDEEIVMEITGLSGLELKRFLAFCKPSLTFLEEATEYQVILAIQRYHRQFKNINRY